MRNVVFPNLRKKVVVEAWGKLEYSGSAEIDMVWISNNRSGIALNRTSVDRANCDAANWV